MKGLTLINTYMTAQLCKEGIFWLIIPDKTLSYLCFIEMSVKPNNLAVMNKYVT